MVADIRKAVFDNVLGLSPQFFEVTRTGEVLSRMTADTTLIQTVVGSSRLGGAAQPGHPDRRPGPDVRHQPEAGAAGGGRGGAGDAAACCCSAAGCASFRRQSQDRIADTAARGSETLNAVPTVQAFTQENYERTRFRRGGGTRFRFRPQPHPGARRADGGGDLHRLRQPGHRRCWSGCRT